MVFAHPLWKIPTAKGFLVGALTSGMSETLWVFEPDSCYLRVREPLRWYVLIERFYSARQRFHHAVIDV